MTINILMFEYRDAEKKFFENNEIENCNITFFKECLTEEFLDSVPQKLLDETTAISVFINSKISKEILTRFKNLRIVSTRSTAYDHICIEACSDKNIALVNVPDYGKVSVAQYTMGAILSLVRNFPRANYAVRGEKISYNNLVGRDLTSMTLGIIGTGAIGEGVCRLAKAFGMKVIGYDITPKREILDKYDFIYMSKDEVIKNSDVISLHLPYYEGVKFLVDDKFLSKCKDGVYLVNTSQSELTDLKSVVKYLKNGKLKGFAMDFLTCDKISYACSNVLPSEASSGGSCTSSNKYFEELLSFENVIVTPHIAYFTQEAVDLILKKTFENIKKALQGDKMCRVV